MLPARLLRPSYSHCCARPMTPTSQLRVMEPRADAVEDGAVEQVAATLKKKAGMGSLKLLSAPARVKCLQTVEPLGRVSRYFLSHL